MPDPTQEAAGFDPAASAPSHPSPVTLDAHMVRRRYGQVTRGFHSANMPLGFGSQIQAWRL